MTVLITPVILSGGSGTRLWPVSRTTRPKQLQALTGADTLLQMTLARVADRAVFSPPTIVASERHVDEIERQLAVKEIVGASMILEPCARNTAPAIALAALEADKESLLLVMPSDHVIQKPEVFLAAVQAAATAAAEGWLVTFGVRPTHAETGYGYISRGSLLHPQVFAASSFIEKPERAAAERMLADGGYDWNSGIFLFRADRYVEELGVHAPDILAAARASLAAAQRNGTQIIPQREAFETARSESVDHAVMEHARKVSVVPVEMEWSDVGSWDALHHISAKDDFGNATRGQVIALDSRDCLLRSDGPAIVTIGVSDLIVVATNDAVMIVPRGDSQRVKEVVTMLEQFRYSAVKQ